MNNFPAISDPLAMQRFPEARHRERDALLALVEITEGMSVVDIQAAGGYMADKIFQQYQRQVTCYCIEPCDALRQRISPNHIALADPVERFYSLDDGAVDVVVGLAGLHHSKSHQSTIAECYRVLKPAGQFAVCDVLDGSNIARWLDEFVDQHNPAGHSGLFVAPQKTSALIRSAGFVGVEETVVNVPWQFPCFDDVMFFFRSLFGLVCDDKTLRQAIANYFSISDRDDGIEVEWQLLYLSGVKHV